MRGRIRPCADTALSVELGEGISPEVHRRVLSLAARLRGLAGVAALVPSYRALLVQYDPWEISFEALGLAIEAALAAVAPPAAGPGSRIEIPVCYDADFGPDLGDVAHLTGLAPARVIALHTRPDYLVYFLGFTPGFAYLGGLPPELTVPRLAEPRARVPAGTVAIAAGQAGAYAVTGPGGWRLLGRTPLRLFDAGRADAALLRAGDRVRFRAVSRAEYLTLGGEP